MGRILRHGRVWGEACELRRNDPLHSHPLGKRHGIPASAGVVAEAADPSRTSIRKLIAAGLWTLGSDLDWPVKQCCRLGGEVLVL